MDGIYTKYLKYGLPLTLTTSLRMPSVESTFGKKIQSMNLFTSYEHLPYPVCILYCYNTSLSYTHITIYNSVDILRGCWVTCILGRCLTMPLVFHIFIRPEKNATVPRGPITRRRNQEIDTKINVKGVP